MVRRFISWLLIAGFIWLIVSRLSEFTNFSQILGKGHILWIAVAIALQILQYFLSSVSYRAAFKTVGVKSRLRELFPLLFSAMFINVIAPAGGASGAALFVDNAAQNGQSTARTAAGVLLQLITSMVAFLLVLTAGMTYLGIQQKLQSYHIIAAGILVLGIIVMSAVLFLAIKHPALLRRVLGWLQSIVNGAAHKVKKATVLSDEWIDQHVNEFVDAGTAIVTHPFGLIWTLGALLLANILNIAVLYTLFLAFGLLIPIGTLVAGYAIGILFLIVSITPQGIGVVEGIMPVVFGSLGIPNSGATVTVMAFRGLSLWLPLLLGFLILLRMKFFKSKKPKKIED